MMGANDIDPIDRDLLAAAFNSNGYVLDFTDSSFAQFTSSSVGISIQDTYKLSKGKSLYKFTHDAETSKVVKLYRDLIKYFEHKWVNEVVQKTERAERILKLKGILDKYDAHNFTRPQMPKICGIDRQYIKSLTDRAYNDVDSGDFDSALTKAKTLLEEVFCYVLEKNGLDKDKHEDINSLYNEVKSLYAMRQSPEYDKRVNGLLAGLEKILSSISEMRNAQSDAHGVGRKRIKILAHHARLYVNAAVSMAEFILSVNVSAK